MKEREDKLWEAVARLKQESQAQDVPKEVMDQTRKRIADCGWRTADSQTHTVPVRHRFRLILAAAACVLLGYAAARLSAPRPVDVEQLRETLIPSVASAIEPALRQQVVADIRRDYQLALAGLYVRVKEELTEQYRSDLNRYAVQTLAASNAVTNELLTQLVQSIDTAQTRDLRRIAQVLAEIEKNRVQDKTQLASGLQTLAYGVEDELSRTKQQFVQLLADVHPTGFDRPSVEPRQTPVERNKP